MRAQGLPPAANSGMAALASDVGFTGANTIQSWPITSEVWAQSRRAFARRNRTCPKFSPVPIVGKPPKKSVSTTALVFAPKTGGTVARRPKRVCRAVAETSPGPPTTHSGTSWLLTPSLLLKPLNIHDAVGHDLHGRRLRCRRGRRSR